MPAIARSVAFAYLSSLLVALLALGALWFGLGRPMAMPDVASASHKLQCASYTPFGKDQSPFQQPLQIRVEQLEQDLALLSQQFQCLRTYSVTGLEALPDIARKHGLKLMVGAWVNSNPQDTRKEIQGLIQVANQHPDVIQAVIVGNEALLRKEVTAPQLTALIAEVKAAVKQPVTYADVWEFWLQHPEVAPAVDFITIHLLPYWEDQPSGIDAALHQVTRVRQRFGEEFAPKDILIGETGWPSEGRQRETALPSRVNQALFIRGFVALAEQHGWNYNLIEAVDQPWKRISEGAVGGFWGLLDADRQDKGILAGPVSNVPLWPWWLAGSVGVFIAGLLLAGRPNGRRSAWLLPLTSALGAACLTLWAQQGLINSRSSGEWLWVGLLGALNGLVLAHALLQQGRLQGWRVRLEAWLQARGDTWLLATAFAAAVMAVQLAFDGRYRGFPSAALLLPALIYCCRPVLVPRRQGLLLAGLIGLCILYQLYQETLSNVQALGWAAVCALVLLALWRSLRLKSLRA